MSKTQPTESQIDVLMSDWLGNLRMKQEGNYTHRGKGGIRRKVDTTMREYLLGDVKRMDNLELMKQSRIGAEKIINTVTPHQVKIQIGGNGSYHAETEDGRQIINIASDYFDDSIPNEEKVDIMFGLASHEAAHSAYTDNSIKEKNINKEHPDLRELKQTVWNIIEDERIEYHLGEERPGLAGCLGATKGYYFDRLNKKMAANGQMPTEPIPKLLAAITQAVRYPSEMTREQIVENFDELDAVRRALTPYPLSPEAAWEATDRVMDIIRHTAEEEIKKQQQEQQQGQSGQNGENTQDDDKSQLDKKKGQQGKPTVKQVRDMINQALSTSQGKSVMDAIKQDIAKGDPANKTQEANDGIAMEYVNNDDSERMSSMNGTPGKGAGGGNPDTFIRKPKGHPDVYQQSLSKVRAYVPAMARALKCKSEENDYVLLSQPRGKLDTNKLVSFRAGNENIFRRSGTVTCSSASVCMLIDESGSMDGARLYAAREAAILVNEAVKRVKNVNFYCYGYTSSQLNVYSEDNRISPWALSDTAAISGTPTGRSMAMAAKRVRKHTKDPILMLVLTDGCADNSARVIEQDNILRTKGFLPVGVGILTNAVSKTFKDHIVMTDISKFAIEMGRLTKGKLDKMLVRTDSNA